MKRPVVLLTVLLFVVAALYPASLELISPKGGESYKAGEEVMIRWKAEGIKGNVTLELIKNGAYFGTIVKMPAAYGSYRWKAGYTAGNKAASGDFFIKIISEDRKYMDSTRSHFTVARLFSSKKPVSMKPAGTLKTTAKPALSKAYDLRKYRPSSKRPALSRTITARFETMRPMVDAYKNAVKSPAAGKAALKGIIAQLKKTGPIGYVNGYWVAVVDMTRIYALPEVGIAMRSSMTTQENTRFDSLVTARDPMDSAANAFVIFIPAKEAGRMGLDQIHGFHNDIIHDPQMGGFDPGFIDSVRGLAGLGALDNVGGGGGMGGGFGLGSAIDSGAAILGAWIGGLIGGPLGSLIGAAVTQGIVLLVDWIVDWFEDDDQNDNEQDSSSSQNGDSDSDKPEDGSSSGIIEPWWREGLSSGYLESHSGVRSVIAVDARVRQQDLMMGLAGAYLVADSMIRSGEMTADTVRSTTGMNMIMAF